MGASVTQLTVPLAHVPWTRTTGRGGAALGRHDQSLAPTTPGAARALAAAIGSSACAGVASAPTRSEAAATNSDGRRRERSVTSPPWGHGDCGCGAEWCEAGHMGVTDK